MSKISARQRYIHPFPARMAPEIAINSIKDLRQGEKILDPMAGSGTVLQYAALNKLKPIGFDLDPLAILLSTVITQKINIKRLKELSKTVISKAKKITLNKVVLSWIDNDKETSDFVQYWFATKQKNSLRKLAFVLNNYKKRNGPSAIEVNALLVAFSRIIITKKIGASLAWDISHSRPHKVKHENDFNVFEGFEKSVRYVIAYLESQKNIRFKGKISLGDVRKMKSIPNNSIDRVITSPPYLNAIDYMRGHKFSLVWLGHSISSLRDIRSTAIGVEKRIDSRNESVLIEKILTVIVKNTDVSEKQRGMIKRYINDSVLLMSEISRVLKSGKKATLVVGNSTLSGAYIKNSQVFCEAGKLLGLTLNHMWKREIPINKRYLPTPIGKTNSLSKRMKHEMVMTFQKS